jgi:5'-nucleotidase
MKKVQASIDPLVIAISSRALFDLAESHLVYENEGLDAYQRYQIEREDKPLGRGVAFELVQKLLHLNDLLEESPVQVILLSRNSADTGLRIFNSIEHYGLNITRAAFCSGDSPYRYISAFNSHLFLSTDGADVRQALELGVAAATILPSNKPPAPKELLKIAFDGDAVLFSDDSEKIYKTKGLEAFTKNEREAANEPLAGGPFKPFLGALQQIQRAFPPGEAPIRTCLVTARAAPCGPGTSASMNPCSWVAWTRASSCKPLMQMYFLTISRAIANLPAITWPPAMFLMVWQITRFISSS